MSRWEARRRIGKKGLINRDDDGQAIIRIEENEVKINKQGHDREQQTAARNIQSYLRTSSTSSPPEIFTNNKKQRWHFQIWEIHVVRWDRLTFSIRIYFKEVFAKLFFSSTGSCFLQSVDAAADTTPEFECREFNTALALFEKAGEPFKKWNGSDDIRLPRDVSCDDWAPRSFGVLKR